MIRATVDGTAIRWMRRVLAERGAELIEFALVFPLLLGVVLGIIDFGFLFRNYEVLVNAAREGARVAILEGYTEPDVQARVAQYVSAGGLPGTPTTVRILPYGANVGGACITLTGAQVTYDHTFLFVGPIVALLGGSGFTTRSLTATSTMRYEGPAATCP
jgi:Flp pilus assembly protein TadG